MSYRALDIEQIGYVYEGLLERTVVRAREVTLDLQATKSAKTPWVTLDELESAAAEGETAVKALLRERTGRSASRVKNDFAKTIDDAAADRLLTACHGDRFLRDRMKSYLRFLRIDRWGYPLVYPEGTFMVIAGVDRRETGTHYTPKSLTETIVKETLEPLVYVGPAEGRPRDAWILKEPSELLDLKICDPAMGSGAFLVQACRWLSERLVEVWTEAATAGKAITAEGEVVDDLGESEPLRDDAEDRLLTARRLIAERCLYGVDMNPLAVELAKLSIWLITLARGRPFGFLDHNLRRGDSLLGIHDLDQLVYLDMSPGKGSSKKLFAAKIDTAVQRALELRAELRSRPIRDIRDVEFISFLDERAQRKLDIPRLIADAFIADAFVGCAKRDTISLSIEAGNAIDSPEANIERLAQRVRNGLGTGTSSSRSNRRPFHWPLEFPEVFHRRNPGFDGVVGNPPFLGNRLWKGTHSEALRRIVQMVIRTPPGKVDLCVAFHRRVVDLLRTSGGYGMLATSNIAQGSAISVGLGEIVKNGNIHFSRKALPWPGKATVVVAIVCFWKGTWRGRKDADGRNCERIGSRLEGETGQIWAPKVLQDALYSFAGIDNSKGLAFVVTSENVWFKRLKSEPDSLLRPYVTGNDITKYALNRVERWALDLADLDLNEIKQRWPVAYRFLKDVVRPTRTQSTLKSYKGLLDRWWQFWNHRADQMRRLRQRDRFIAFSKVTKHPICMLAPSEWIYTNKVLLIGAEREDLFTICLSSFFRSWLETYSGGKMGERLGLSINESVAKFPQPADPVSRTGVDAATHFNECAAGWAASQECGLTEMMNEIHTSGRIDEQIVKLRSLLEVIDREVAAAYGWNDLDLVYKHYTISSIPGRGRTRFTISGGTRVEMLRRLVNLNRKRYGDEQTAALRRSGSRESERMGVLYPNH